MPCDKHTRKKAPRCSGAPVSELQSVFHEDELIARAADMVRTSADKFAVSVTAHVGSVFLIHEHHVHLPAEDRYLHRLHANEKPFMREAVLGRLKAQARAHFGA